MNATPAPAPRRVDRLDLEALPEGRVSHLLLALVEDGAARPIRVPVLVARGRRPGPVLGLTAVVHGNELNGMRVVHRMFSRLDPEALAGTVVGVPVVNIPGYLNNRREMADGADLNLHMPGREDGNAVQQYAHRFVTRVVERLDYLVDLHTASFGRVNSLYVRADLTHPTVSWMARAQHPQIIVQHKGADGTLRSAAMGRGIPAITVEVGDPQVFQGPLIRLGFVGIWNVMCGLDMIAGQEEEAPFEPVVCRRSYWLYTDLGGLLTVRPQVTERVREGDVLARISDPFGTVRREYLTPEDGVVVGRSTNPVGPAGSRIVHLGLVGEPEAAVPGESDLD